MTVTILDTHTLPSNISRVAVIGGGPAGLTSVYELLHTSKDGVSTVGGELPDNPAFTKVQGYEQLSDVGGVWNASLDNTDPVIPTSKALDTDKYNDPFVLKPPKQIPADLKDQKEFTRPLEQIQAQYSNSGVYDHLYTNIPQDYMGFSYLKNPSLAKSSIRPFLRYYEVLERLQKLTNDYDLGKHFRFNTEVELVTYNPQTKIWTLVSRTLNHQEQTETWRSEEFDAVIIAGGQNNIPYFPIIKGLKTYTETFPGKVIHGKAYRSAEQLRDKKVLIIGSSSTASNVISTGFPIAKEIYLSRKTAKHNFDYLNRVFASDGIITKPQVKEFHKDGSISFTDDSIITDIDLVIIATGYIYHVPYLQPGLLNLNSTGDTPLYSRKADDLFLHAFNIYLPSLAFVGIPNTPTVWRAIETTAAAVAGIWSRSKQLPSIDKQLEWKFKRLEETGNTKKFQQYPHEFAKQKLIDPLYEFAAKNRQNPLPDDSYIEVISNGLENCERLFYEFKEGRLKE